MKCSSGIFVTIVEKFYLMAILNVFLSINFVNMFHLKAKKVQQDAINIFKLVL